MKTLVSYTPAKPALEGTRPGWQAKEGRVPPDTSPPTVAVSATQVKKLAGEAGCLCALVSRVEERLDAVTCTLQGLLGGTAGLQPLSRSTSVPSKNRQGSRRPRPTYKPWVISVLLLPSPASAGSTLYIDVPATSSFSVVQIKDLPRLVERLVRHSDLVSDFLWGSLSDRDQLLLKTWQSSGPGADKVKNIIIQVLNSVIGDSRLYEAQRFQGVLLRTEALDLIKRSPVGSIPSLLNRFLLEDTFHQELTRCQHIGLPPLVAVVMETLQANTGRTTDSCLVGWKSVADIQAALKNATGQLPSGHAVKQLVFRLRRLLESHGESPSLVQNNPRLGYRFAVRREIKTAANRNNH